MGFCQYSRILCLSLLPVSTTLYCWISTYRQDTWNGLITMAYSCYLTTRFSVVAFALPWVINTYLLVVIHISSSEAIWTANRDKLIWGSDKFVFENNNKTYFQTAEYFWGGCYIHGTATQVSWCCLGRVELLFGRVIAIPLIQFVLCLDETSRNLAT